MFVTAPLMTTVIAGQDPATLRAWLADAQAKLQQVMIGGRAVSVSYGEKSVTYTPANAGQLVAWIHLLQRQLGLVPARRAITPIFW